MNAEHGDVGSNHNPNDPTAKRANGSDKKGTGTPLRRAMAVATRLPSLLDERMKRSPYAMLGVACAVGAGVGVFLSSRIVRAVFTAAATAAAIDLMRALVRQEEGHGEPS
jgi:hypothetical protein